MNGNRARVFADVLSLDAWHETFSTSGKTASVFVELSFKEGQIGGDSSDFPFTFRISLKRALLTVRVEDPLELDRRSVDRSSARVEVERSETRTRSQTTRASAGATVRFSPTRVTGELTADARLEGDSKIESIDKKHEKVKPISVFPIPVDRRTYSWELTPSDGTHLFGQPWHPIDAPRLAVKPLLREPTIEPAISVTISCALDDVIISDIEYKNPPPLLSLDKIVPRNTVAVAVQHLKKLLVEADLEPGAMDDRFSRIILGMVMSCVE